ncbi:DUF4150 domain-containing protein [Polaromonas sp.]|jgi:hypothetical protein|uniref:DUF4150 domain-containing protein n=1 Tax=Polaromonas TaxID=52972 RepID=UPI003264E115
MFANTNLCVINFAFPDVCLVPTPVGPVPIPFPNIVITISHIPSQACVIIGGGLAENLVTQGTLSNGDEPGVNLGVVSGMEIGPDRYLMGSFKVAMGGVFATRLTSVVGQNGMIGNAIGMSITPSQVCVMVLG